MTAPQTDSLYTTEQVEAMVGHRMPTGSAPAAWWVSDNAAVFEGWARYRSDRDAQHERLVALAKRLGCLTDNDDRTGAFARYYSGFGHATLSGFVPPYDMRTREAAPNHIAVPEHWRIGAKKGLLVPSRKTKADRESSANADFQSVARIPVPNEYLSGLPTSLSLDDREAGGTIYMTNYRRGADCVMAFLGGDPDRAPRDERHSFEWDRAVWDRRPLSELHRIREHTETAAAAGEQATR